MRTKLVQFLQNEDTIKNITSWSLKDIPKEEYGDNWALIEEKLDNAIDLRISTVLQNWEVERKLFTAMESEMTTSLSIRMAVIEDTLSTVEAELRNLAGDPTESRSLGHSRNELRSPLDKTQEAKDFKLEFSPEFMSQPESEKLIHALFNPSMLFKIKDRQKEIRDSAEKFQRSRTDFMKERSQTVLKALQGNGPVIKQLVDDQLAHTKDYILSKTKHAQQVIDSNRSLIKAVWKDRRERHQIEDLYKPHEDTFNELFENALKFKNANILEYEYPRGIFSGDRKIKKTSF